MPAVADIVKVEAPASASFGETVTVYVSVKNISSSDKNITVTGAYDSALVDWLFDYLQASPGKTIIMPGKFTMPNKSVRVTVWSWWWDGTKWVKDDSSYRDISLVILTPQFANFGLGDYSKV